MRAAADRPIDAPPDLLDARITLRVRDMRWRHALDELARGADCGVGEEGGALRAFRLSPEEIEERDAESPGSPWVPAEAGPGTVTVDLRRATLDAALACVRETAGSRIAVSRELHAAGHRIRLRLDGVPWQQVLLAIAAEADLERRIREIPESARTGGDRDRAFTGRNLSVLWRLFRRNRARLLGRQEARSPTRSPGIRRARRAGGGEPEQDGSGSVLAVGGSIGRPPPRRDARCTRHGRGEALSPG